MKTYNHSIEEWWRHLGTYDREQVSDIPYIRNGKKEPIGKYLKETDDWWDGLTNNQKLEAYNEFFSEE
jgi:hypothetical protein